MVIGMYKWYPISVVKMRNDYFAEQGEREKKKGRQWFVERCKFIGR